VKHLTSLWRRLGRRTLPVEGMFSPGQDTLDPRIFDGDRMRTELRLAVLSLLDGFWTPKYGDWRKWARVYLAGSGASHWWDSDVDLDILIGINKEALDQARPQNVGVSEEDVCGHLNVEFNRDLETTTLEWHGFKTQFHCNPGSWNIQDINPYAAYDITNNEWAQKPPVLPPDWGPHAFPDFWWDEVNTTADQIETMLLHGEVPFDQVEEGAAFFDKLYSERQRAYSLWGNGWVDYGNFQYQVLSQWGVLQPLYRAKQAWKLLRSKESQP
jgi:hypothetical protein